MAEKVRTHRVPLTASYFLRSGFTANLTATWIDQEVTYPDPDVVGFSTITGDDQFWVLDGSIDYRLPRRLGVISLQVNNLLDEDFHFQDIDPENPEVLPERLVLGKFTLSF